MKLARLLPASLLTIAMIAVSSFSASAQQTQREQQRSVREQARSLANAVQEQQMQSILAAQSFAFNANLLVSSMDANISNIQLNNTLYGVWVRPQRVDVYLPVYGTANFTSSPSLLRQLEFDDTNYSYKLQKLNEGWQVTINATDDDSANTYTFQFTVTPDGTYSTLVLTSAFAGPVTFQGTVGSL